MRGILMMDFRQISKLIAFPTETVYGLGASIYDLEAIEQVFQLKGRPQDNPLIVHVASVDEIEPLAHISPKLKLLEIFWPGPLTVVLQAKEVPEIVRAGLPTVGIRIPNHPLALELLKKRGPMVAPSANLSGKPSPTCASHVLEDFDIPVIDGGPCQVGLESTILSLVGQPTLLRPGAITKAQLEAALDEEVLLSKSKKALAPGMKYRHYAPKAPLLLFKSPQALWEHLQKYPRKKRVLRIGINSSELYNFLRECDLHDIEEINLLITEKMCSDLALMNRLEKAAFC